MAKKTEKESAEKMFKEFKRKIDQFLSELDETNSRFQKNFKERFHEVKEASSLLKKEIKDKERWNEVNAALRRAGRELKKAAQVAFGDKKKTSSPKKKKKAGKTAPSKKTTKKSTGKKVKK